MNWLETAGRAPDNPRVPALKINSVVAIKYAVQRGIGLALLPDYIVEADAGLVQLIPEAELPKYNTYFVYPAELKNTARVSAFRDFPRQQGRHLGLLRGAAGRGHGGGPRCAQPLDRHPGQARREPSADPGPSGRLRAGGAAQASRCARPLLRWVPARSALLRVRDDEPRGRRPRRPARN